MTFTEENTFISSMHCYNNKKMNFYALIRYTKEEPHLQSIHFAILLPFFAALVVFLSARLKLRLHIGWFALLIPISLFAYFIQKVPSMSAGKQELAAFPWIPTFDIHFITYLDGLSLLFSLLITGIGTLVIFYSIYYMTKDQQLYHFYIYLLLFMGSMLGVVLSDHVIVLYVFWELTSISSFLLIAFWYQRKGSRYGAKKSLLITVFGGFAMLAGFLALYTITGSFSIREIMEQVPLIKQHALFIPIIILILLGAFTKSVQFPFHIWLPDAMEAPTPISSYLHSATMVKAGIYLVARLTPIFGGEMLWFWLITATGLFTLLWAAFNALRQSDLKALLAYSTISQLGLIMSLFGIGSLSYVNNLTLSTALLTQATFAALFHLVNHATFKGALFMIIGIIDFQIGTRDLRRLGGLMAFMPISFSIALIGSFSMAGLPPFNGFLSKEMFFTAMLHIQSFDIFSVESIALIFPVVAWIASIFTFVYSMMIVFETFLGEKQGNVTEETKEPPYGMLLPPFILSILVVLIFFFPNVLADWLLKPAIIAIYPFVQINEIATIRHWHGFNTELWMTIGILLVGTILFAFRQHVKKVFFIFPQSLSLDRLYNRSLFYADRLAYTITESYMTGYLRDYLSYLFVFVIVLIGGSFAWANVSFLQGTNDGPIHTFEWMLAFTIIVAAIAIPLAKSRLNAILINGFIGFAIAMFFVLFRAPDLALTQLVVETVTTALFLLAFYFLPEWEKKRPPIQWRNVFIALAVGTTFTLIALAVHNNRLFTSISYYFEAADQLAGANNIVNTILGDFRAFDTMLEVIVLFIAGIGVYSLIKYRKKGADKLED